MKHYFVPQDSSERDSRTRQGGLFGGQGINADLFDVGFGVSKLDALIPCNLKHTRRRLSGDLLSKIPGTTTLL